MKRSFAIIFILSALVALAPSCTRFAFTFGQGIRFSASTGGATRAAYSDKFYTEGIEKERIDWENGDEIAIYCKEATWPDGETKFYKTYAISGVTPSGAQSRGSLNLEEGEELRWGEEVPHNFYFVYPAPGADAVTESFLEEDGGICISGSIPAGQKALRIITESNPVEAVPDLGKYMMQAGCHLGQTPTPDAVDLYFEPISTCLDMTITNGTGRQLKVKKVEFCASGEEKLSGNFTLVPGNDGAEGVCTTVDGTGSVFLTFDEGDVTLDDEATFRFKLFANPGNDFQDPYFIITSWDGIVRKAQLRYQDMNDGDGHHFIFTKKHKKIMTGLIVPDGVVWTDLAFNEPQLSPWETSTEDLGLMPEYTYVLEGMDALQNVNFPAEGGTETLGPIVSYKISCDDKDTKIGVKPIVSGPVWANCTVEKDDTRPDPTYNIFFSNVGRNETSESHSEKLKGAASKGTSANPWDLSLCNPATGAGYRSNPQNSSQTTANCYVVDAPGYYKFPLKQGNSSTAVSAAAADVLWQDVSGMVVVDGVADGYIKFHIDADKIQQANALIAGRNSSGGTIQWSWHIWVTDENLTKQSSSPFNTIMPVNLGWVADASTMTYVPRSSDLNISFEETGGPFKDASKNLTVSQDALPNAAEGNGSSPYYQWGRKDPFFKGAYSASKASRPSAVTATNLNQNPNVLYYPDRTAYENWVDGFAKTFWSSKNEHDPCPVGFRVISETVANNILSSEAKNFPLCGKLGEFSGNQTNPNTGCVNESTSGYYWISNVYISTGMNDKSRGYAIIVKNSSATKYTDNSTETISAHGFSVRPEFE